MDLLNSKLTILFGSQTGTAQDVAERLWRQSKRSNLTATVLPMDDYPIVNIPQDNFLIFICSTTGQGDEPDNMKTFWKILLRKSLPPNSLGHINFAVLGLGDSSYVKFNFVAKRLFKRVVQLGGVPLIPIYLADEQHDLGVDFTVDAFMKDLWGRIGVRVPELGNELILRWKVVSSNDVGVIEGDGVKVMIKSNDRITDELHFQDVRLIKFTSEIKLNFKPGDVVTVLPKNNLKQINYFYETLINNNVILNLKDKIKLQSNYPEIELPFKNGITLEEICLSYWDLSGIPRRSVFELLSQITPNELEREKLVEFSSPEGCEELYNYCNRPKRNIIEVLNDFPFATSKLTLELLFELMQPIRKREFSIASGGNENEVEIMVAVVNYKTKLIKKRLGLCSNYLAGLQIGDNLKIGFKNGTFKFPQNGNIVMVGPGTGVAPFRSYILDKIRKGGIRDDLVLFFGNRYRDKDFLIKNDWENNWNSFGKLKLICAFSRDQNQKIYVQDKIKENRDYLFDLIKNQEASIFVAGNSKNMPTEVKNAFIEIISEEFIENLVKIGKYQTETWS